MRFGPVPFTLLFAGLFLSQVSLCEPISVDEEKRISSSVTVLETAESEERDIDRALHDLYRYDFRTFPEPLRERTLNTFVQMARLESRAAPERAFAWELLSRHVELCPETVRADIGPSALRLLGAHVANRIEDSRSQQRAADEEREELIKWMRSGTRGPNARRRLQRASDLLKNPAEIIRPGFDSRLVSSSLRTLTNVNDTSEAVVYTLVRLIESFHPQASPSDLRLVVAAFQRLTNMVREKGARILVGPAHHFFEHVPYGIEKIANGLYRDLRNSGAPYYSDREYDSLADSAKFALAGSWLAEDHDGVKADPVAVAARLWLLNLKGHICAQATYDALVEQRAILYFGGVIEPNDWFEHRRGDWDHVFRHGNPRSRIP